MLIFHASLRELGSNNVRNSSYTKNAASSVRVSRLLFHFLWLWIYECKYSGFTFWKFNIFCKVWFRWWKITTAIIRACWCLQEKMYSSKWARRRIKVLSNMKKKTRKSFKTLSELKLKFISKLGKGKYGLQDPP